MLYSILYHINKVLRIFSKYSITWLKLEIMLLILNATKQWQRATVMAECSISVDWLFVSCVRIWEFIAVFNNNDISKKEIGGWVLVGNQARHVNAITSFIRCFSLAVLLIKSLAFHFHCEQCLKMRMTYLRASIMTEKEFVLPWFCPAPAAKKARRNTMEEREGKVFNTYLLHQWEPGSLWPPGSYNDFYKSSQTCWASIQDCWLKSED